jgi:hypothetical protein
VILTCHDWRNERSDCPWNQSMIRQGYAANGYWEIEVEHDGLYRFDLRRWPGSTQHALTAGIGGDDITWQRDWIHDQYAGWYSGGAALTITQAQISLQYPHAAPINLSSPVQSADHTVAFEIALQAGPAHLTTTFENETGLSIGAYFVHVRRVN